MKHIKLFEDGTINEDRNAAVKLLDQMRDDLMLSDKKILEFIIYNHLDGREALEALKAAKEDLTQ